MIMQELEISNIATANISLTNVNNDMLADSFVSFSNEVITNALCYLPSLHKLSIPETGDSILEAIGDSLNYFCEISQDNNYIEQFDVICDKRNNNFKSMQKREFNVELTYKQKDCLNVTSIHYKIIPIEQPEIAVDLASDCNSDYI